MSPFPPHPVSNYSSSKPEFPPKRRNRIDINIPAYENKKEVRKVSLLY